MNGPLLTCFLMLNFRGYMLSKNEMSFHESMKQQNHWTLIVMFALMWRLKS